MKELPEPHRYVQEANARDGSAHPSRRDETLQAVTGLTRRQQQKVIVAPVAETPPAVRHPRQDGEHNADLEAQDYVENYRESRRHRLIGELERNGSSLLDRAIPNQTATGTLKHSIKYDAE